MTTMSTSDDNRLNEIAEYAEQHDFSAEIEEQGTWHPGGEPDADPMVSSSLRLPKSLLDWARAEADKNHVRPTALIRTWIEEKRADTETLAQRGHSSGARGAPPDRMTSDRSAPGPGGRSTFRA